MDYFVVFNINKTGFHTIFQRCVNNAKYFKKYITLFPFVLYIFAK